MAMSIRKYAEHRGVSHTAVRKAIESGRIQREPAGGIDPKKADVQWESQTRPGQTHTQAVQPADDPGGTSYHRARAVREAYAARLTKLEYEERSGKLVDADEIRVTIFNQGRLFRDRMQQIPRRMAPLVAAENDARVVEEMLDSAVREALEELSR